MGSRSSPCRCYKPWRATLGVSVRDLRPDALTESGDESPVPNDLDSLRLELSGRPALGVLFATAEAAEPVDYDELHVAVDNVWTLAHESQYAALSDALTELLPRLEHAVREDQGDERKRVHALRARAYQAAAAAFARQDEADAAWVAADRAISPLSYLEARSR